MLSGLCAGVVYTASVEAVNSAGAGPASPPSALAVPLAAQVPGSPLIASVTSRQDSLVVVWNAPVYDGGDAITGYAVTATAGSQVVSVSTPAKARATTIKGLTDGTDYTVKVSAVSKVGTSAATTSSGTPEALYAPSAPVQFTTIPNGSGAVTAAWLAPANDGGASLTGYEISYQQEEQSTAGVWSAVPGAPTETLDEAATATMATVTSFPVTPAFYLFSITASNGAGPGATAAAAAPVSPTTAVKSTTVVLTAASVSALDSVTANSLVWKDPAPSQVRAIKVGDVVTCSSEGLIPDGMWL